MFWTSFTFLKKGANFEQNDSSAEWFEANVDHAAFYKFFSHNLIYVNL